MTSEQTSKLGKLLLFSIIILILQIVAAIIHAAWWSVGLSFIINRSTIITLAAMLLVTAIVGPRVIEKQNYIPLIIGIMMAALSAILIIYILDPLIHNAIIVVNYPHMSPINMGLYILLIVIHSVSIALSVLNLIRGIRLIIDYTHQSS
jgi:hypothetical protein